MILKVWVEVESIDADHCSLSCIYLSNRYPYCDLFQASLDYDDSGNGKIFRSDYCKEREIGSRTSDLPDV